MSPHAEHSAEGQSRAQFNFVQFLARLGCGLGLLMLVLTIADAFISAKAVSRASACKNHERQLATGLLMYAEDHDGRYPPADRWSTVTVDRYLKDRGQLACPSRSKAVNAYAFNALLGSRKENDVLAPAEALLLFESSRNRLDAADHGESFVKPHAGRGVLAFADGHVSFTRVLPSAEDGIEKPGRQR